MEGPSPKDGAAAGGRGALSAWLEGLRRTAPLSARVLLGVMLAAVSLASAFFISPGLYAQQIPQIDPEQIGKPFRSPSPSGFKAGRDYEIVHSALTEERRDEARAAIRPVFDYDPSVQSGINKAVQAAFGDMQEIVAAFEQERAAAEKPPPPAKPGAPTTAEGQPAPEVTSAAQVAAAVPKRKMTEQELEKEAQELRRRFEEARKRFEAHLGPSEQDDFDALAAHRFSREVERSLSALVEGAYRMKVVGSRDELARVGAQGITVRIVGGSSEHHSSTAGSSIHDVRDVHSEMDRFASVPGNLLPDTPGVLRRAVLRLAKQQIRPNLTINIAETEARRRAAADAVKDAVITIKKGQKVIGDGELINATHLVMVEGMRAQTDKLDLVELQLGGTGLVALLIAGCWTFCVAAFRRFRPTRKDAFLLGALLVTMLALMRVWVTVSDAVHDRYGSIPLEALYFFMPVAAGAMLVRFILSEEMSLLFAVVFALLAGMLLGNSLAFGVYTLVGSVVAAERIPRAKDRVGIFKAGVVAGAANALTVVLLQLVEGKGFGLDAVVTAGFAFGGAALAVPVLTMALAPLIEAGLGYASDIKLLELANLNHPALKELIVQAPGTYHHSIIMGSLVESAAEVIGANPLLARSCAYYHDIGKGRNPLYFGENQKGENRHDALAPAMSAVIIKRHVTEGLEMARQYKLPKLVADAIPQHHGTRLVGFFFHKALKEQEGKENPQPVDDSLYRYPGPKPQFREAALVMIADAVEAASRSMPEPTTAKLHALVQKLISQVFAEGQLDECDLTLRDLNLIAQSFVRTLEGIYHARPSYPAGAVEAAARASEPLKPLLSVAAKDDRDGSKKTGSGG